jgi:NAD(P)-binding Rossmann-like domain
VRRRRLAVVGGGAAGASLLWCLTSQDDPLRDVAATLFHDEDEIGGHSRTIPVVFDAGGAGRVAGPNEPGPVYPIDIGVQFVCPSLYPNLYRQLALPELRSVRLTRHPALRMSGAFSDELVWGNFPDYQTGPRFARCFDPARADAERFERDLHHGPVRWAGGRRVVTMTVGEYLGAAGIRRDGHFFRYLLLPYLSIMSGYGRDLLETTMQDLWPIFSRLPLVQDEGPCGSFTGPGYGWDRFADGATTWVRAMSELARARGAEVRLASRVIRVSWRGSEWLVRWTDGASYGPGGVPLAPGTAVHEAAFDTVVLTTDMITTLELLDHAENPWRPQHVRYLAPDRFRMHPGTCYIHQDASLLAPSLADEREDAQFTGYFAWGARDAAKDAYGLPYDLRAGFQTYLMHNIQGTPVPCYVSIYGDSGASPMPAPDRTLFRRTWRHGRWLAGFFRQAKRELHRVQGLGGLWFAGGSTTMDSEEGALLSAMIVAAHAAGYRFPFPRGSWAWALHGWFHDQMFPGASPGERLRRLVTGRPSRRYGTRKLPVEIESEAALP